MKGNMQVGTHKNHLQLRTLKIISMPLIINYIYKVVNTLFSKMRDLVHRLQVSALSIVVLNTSIKKKPSRCSRKT